MMDRRKFLKRSALGGGLLLFRPSELLHAYAPADVADNDKRLTLAGDLGAKVK